MASFEALKNGRVRARVHVSGQDIADLATGKKLGQGSGI